MKNRIIKIFLSYMTVSLGLRFCPLESKNVCPGERTITVQEIQVKIKPQAYCAPKSNINVIESSNIHEVTYNEMNEKMEEIENITDKKEWYLAYKSIVDTYSDFFDRPETIYDRFTDTELDLLFKVVQAEIGDEYSFEQKINVASVIFNRLEHERFPDDLADILVADQFSSISDGRYQKVEVSDTTILACEYAFSIENTADGCLFFDSNNKLKYKFVFTDGAHNFYKLHNE